MAAQSRRFQQMHRKMVPNQDQRLSANPEQPAGLPTRLGQHARRDDATEKQLAYVGDLLKQVQLTPDQRELAEAQLADGLTKTQASAWIERLKTLKKQQPQQQREPRFQGSHAPNNSDAEGEGARGMYRAPDGSIIRVYLGQQSGYNLCKQLVDTGQPHPEDSSITLHDWEYMGKATSKLPQGSVRMTLEEAMEFGRMTGSCCRCGRRLDVPESVERGIGPVCGRKKNWVVAA